MDSSIHATAAGQKFHALYRRLSRDQANALLNDCIYELSAAWKFLTSLNANLPMFVLLHGFSGVPLAFARHLCRVDVLGFNQEERALFDELAQFKNITNYRVFSAPEEMGGPYGTILWLPTRLAVAKTHKHEWIMHALRHLHPQGEFWIAHQRSSAAASLREHLARIATGLRFGHRAPRAAPIRLLPATEPMSDQLRLDGWLPQFVAPQDSSRIAKSTQYWGIIPNWSSPVYIAPLPPSGPREATLAEPRYALRVLAPKKLAKANHVLARIAPPASSPFIARLLDHLEQRQPGSRIQPNRFRVLAGGKVQIDARWKRGDGESEFFIKLPLAPFAETRLCKQSEMLVYLHSREMLSKLTRSQASMPLSPQRIFPRLVAQGKFENQSYFLESRVKGLPLSHLRMTQEGFRKFCDTLFLFWHQAQSRCGKFIDLDRNWFGQLFQQPLQQLAEWAQPTQRYQEILARLEDFLAGKFSAQPVYLSLVHGDFSTKNILANPQNFELSGIIDWDLAARQSIPLLDVVHFFVRMDVSSFREAPPRIALRLIRPDPAAFHWQYFQAAMTKFGYEPILLPALVVYYWIQRFQVYLDSPKSLDAQFMQRHFYEVLDLFDETLLKTK